MHCLKGPEVERQVLDTVRAAVVKVHARGHLGPRATGQGPGPDRAARATRPRHAGSTPDGPPGPRDVRPPPRAAPEGLHFPASPTPTAPHFRTVAHSRAPSLLGELWSPSDSEGPTVQRAPSLSEAFPAKCGRAVPRSSARGSPAAAPPGPHFPGAAPGMPCARGSASIVRRARDPGRRVPASYWPPRAAPPSPSCCVPDPVPASPLGVPFGCEAAWRRGSGFSVLL